MKLPKLLVVDDEAPVLALIPQLFDGEFEVLTASGGEQALDLLRRHEIGVVIADQRMPGMNGTELLSRVSEEWPEVVRIILTAFADVENLLEAINSGRVYQFLIKPWDNRALATTVRRAMETYSLRAHNTKLLADNAGLVKELQAANDKLEKENRVLRTEVGDRYKAGNMIGASPAMTDVFRLLDKAAKAAATVLITGETGTGKELAAAWVHQNSERRRRKFVPVNCGALPDSLLESELFGHVRGAFTGALRDHPGVFVEANGGTIFLDEIGEMSPTMQVKVLRVVEDGLVRPVGGSRTTPVDVRLVCATNRDLKAEVESGNFRRDLYYRLKVFPVRLPPLRTRDGDVMRLAQHFFHLYNGASGKELQGFTPAAKQCLDQYPWPGNVREIKNEVERAVALADDGGEIDLEHLSAEVTGDEALSTAASGDGKLTDRMERIEQLLILKELRRHRENRTHTAKTLGISVRALQKKIARYGLREPRDS